MSTAIEVNPVIATTGISGSSLLRAVRAAAIWMTGPAGQPSAVRAAETFCRLNGLTDAELAARGLCRDGLVAHCFGHLDS